MNKMMRVIVKVIMVIKFISVLVGLVSITPGHVKLDWLPPPKIDRSNENDRDNKNKNNGKDEDESKNNGKDDGNDDNESDSDSNDKDNDI